LKGRIVIFAAPSGAGKTTISRHALSVFKDLEFSVSATTRLARPHEIHGKDYYFISRKEFQEYIDLESFVEWEEVYPDLFYGTLKSEVQRIWAKGHHVVFDVDVKGALNLKRIYGNNALSVFVMPPSIDVLEKRLRQRNTDGQSAILTRISKAFQEIEAYRFFDGIVVNDRLPKAKEDVERLLRNFFNH
jgi:guanylate kinase